MFQSSVSGLQRLFSSASSSLSPHTQRGQRQLESVTEEAHTYDLLYPDVDSLLQPQHHAYPLRHGDPSVIAAAASSSDDRGGLDLQNPRDVRIVFAQDANTRSPQPRVIYDSQPPTPLSPPSHGASLETGQMNRQRAESFTGGLARGLTGGLTGGGLRRSDGGRTSSTAPHTRHSSLSQSAQSLDVSLGSPLSPVSDFVSIFGSSKSRTAPVRPATSDGETIQGKIAREGREETEAVLDCMFGAATGFPSTSSTKIHIRPPKSSGITAENRPKSATPEPSPTTAFPKRRTPLTRSTTMTELQATSIDTSQRTFHHDNPAVWITRLFTIDLKYPASVSASSAPLENTQQRQQQQQHSHFMKTAPDREIPVKDEKAKQLKTPTYAIAILLQMPSRRQRPLSHSLHRSPGYPANSPQSFAVDGVPSLDTAGLDSDSDIVYVISHWTIIDRALSSLEVVARCKIYDALIRLEGPLGTLPEQSPSKYSSSGVRTSPKKLKQPTQWMMQLPTGALQGCPAIHDTASATGKRVARAMKIRMVIPGQGRWGIWREEARWVDKWAGGQAQNVFFFNLLTAFVGSHTEWLESLAPKRLRRQHAKTLEKGRKESNSIQHRTVIVSMDKMAGRRLVFLLSAFLPGVPSGLFMEGRSQSDTNWANVQRPQSPSGSVPIYRQRSLRRTINRNSGGQAQDSPAITHARSISFSNSESIPGDVVASDSPIYNQQSRRPSDARSVRSAALLISSDGSVTRKSSTTTTATIKPESAIPVAHFAGQSSEPHADTQAGPRPSSHESLAPIALQRTLSLSDSNEHGNTSAGSQPRSGWGSWRSYWSSRRGSSTEESDPLASSEEGLGISGISRSVRSRQAAAKLSQMVDEVEGTRVPRAKQNPAKDFIDPLHPDCSIPEEQAVSRSPKKALPPRKIPGGPSPELFPLKLSVDENDGVVDVDLRPTITYPSSFESTFSSPEGFRTVASSFNEHSSSHNRDPNAGSIFSSSESAGDVAGWLRNYHQDFALQAVRPYSNLKEDIKHSMRTELVSNQSIEGTDPDEWTDVCSTIIADTTTYTITRLRLQRRNPNSPHHRANALLGKANPNISHEEQITEEPLTDLDPTFIDAVERVLSHSGDSSKVVSRAASRAPSPTRHHRHQASTTTTTTESSSAAAAGLEIPRSECKRLVLGALEQVARTVSAEVAAREDVGGKNSGGGGSRRSRNDVPTESILREGVRKWFREVDGRVM